MKVSVWADARAVAQEAAKCVVASAQQALEARGRFTFVLAGGSTPAMLYELLASPEYAGAIDWSRTHVFFGDERCAPADHEWSNYAMARRALLDRVPVSHRYVYRMTCEHSSDEAAVAYAETIGQVLAPEAGAFPRFDLILLGMGGDAHTASLFPGMPVLAELKAWAAGTDVPGYVHPQVPRVTLTLPVLNAAAEVLFLVTGQAKAEPIRRVFLELRRDVSAETLPAARIRPHDGQLIWLLDEPAASLLEGVGDG